MRNWKQRLWSLLLCAAMLVSLCPAAMAEGGGGAENVPYLDETGADRSRDMATIVTDGETLWDESDSSSGWYVVQNSVTIWGRITVSGDVHLILENGGSLEAKNGIQVSAGNRLTIYAQSTNPSAMGRLTAEINSANPDMDASYAGIGGNPDEICGDITINGGTIEAYGNYEAAGIGSGGTNGQRPTLTSGNVTIRGGMITARSVMGTAIGGGTDGGSVTISGGMVTANSGMNTGTAGIGGGSVLISGGTVKAAGGGGPGISGGSGKVTIDDGEVNAQGGHMCAGIASSGGIIINGGVVDAKGDTGGAGIGGSDYGEGGIITIEGGTITAQGGNGAGIGGGSEAEGGTITITGGTVTALGGGNNGGWGGSGIGGLEHSKVTINGGTVTAQGGSGGPGIGSHNPSNDTFDAGGNAFIMASSISKQDGKDQWSGVIFEGEDGKLYNSPVTLAADAEIPVGKTLVIEKGETLIVGEGVKLTNNGTIKNYVTLKNLGTLDGQGKIEGNAVEGSVVHEAAER